MEKYGDFIQKHRKASGFKSQRSLANKSGISPATISRIEAEIQKPEARTLKTLSQYLYTTSYVELMVVSGYWDEDELLEPINTDPKVKEPLASYKTEKEFVDKLELSDEELLKQFNLELDGKRLTKDEAKGIIAYLRSVRSIDK